MMNTKRSRIYPVIILITGLLLTGCASGQSGSISLSTITPIASRSTITATPNPINTPTLPPPTETPAALKQLTPIVIAQPTSFVPTELAADFLDQRFPVASLNIYNPGPGSRISSPLNISAYALPGDQGKVTVQLWGEDGSIIAEQLIKLSSSNSGWVSFTTQFPFEINSGGEAALLTLTTFDGFGRRIAVNSVPLLLIQIGNSEIESTGFAKGPFVLKSPTASSTVTGGTLHLEGYAHPSSSAPLIVELIKTNGGVMASKQVALSTPATGEDYVAFSVDIPYKVSTATPVRLSLRQMTDQAPLKDCALSSELIILEP